MNHTELDLIVAELMFPVLVELAPTGRTIGYKEIADKIKVNNPNISEISNITQRHIGRKLGTIWEFTKSQDCPHIGSLVVNKSGECGDGISIIVKNLPEEREKVKNFDWSSVSLDFGSYISKAKIHKKERETKKVKVSREDAKKLFISYWQEIKKEAPISKDEAIQIKEKAIELIEDGLTPEEAFSKEFIILTKTKQKKSSATGYVYIGEYINRETKDPLFDQLKIGFSQDLEARAIALRGGVLSPLDFNMKYYWEFDLDMAYAVEQALHGRFTEYRKVGEFFNSLNYLLPSLIDDEITQKYEDLLKSSNYG